MNQRFFHSFMCVIVMLLFVVGCGGEKKPPGMPALHKTTLTFMQGGKPLAGAIVSLVPQDSPNEWSVGGTTDDQGVLRVKTMAKFNGAPAGKYKITLAKSETEGTVAAPVETSDSATARPAAQNSQKMYNLIEKDYRFANTTPLVVEIKQGNNTEILDAGKAIRELVPYNTN